MPITIRLMSGQNLSAELQHEFSVDAGTHARDDRGGEGIVYFAVDQQYAVKVYHQSDAQRLQALKKLIEMRRHLGHLITQPAWPLAIVERVNDVAALGAVMRRVPAHYQTLYRLIYSRRDAEHYFEHGGSWLKYLKMARGVAAAVKRLHAHGIAHCDIQHKNFLVDPVSAEVEIIDLDSVTIPGLPPRIQGTRGFMAPEIVMGTNEPSMSTDRHSLAVLILWTLLLRNVMLPRTTLDARNSEADDRLNYGQQACFSEHPTEVRNRPPKLGTPLFAGGALSYRSLTPALQRLTERALIHGLHAPAKRPLAYEWETALAEAYDGQVTCHTCHRQFLYPYWRPSKSERACPLCGALYTRPLAVLNLLQRTAAGHLDVVRVLILADGSFLFRDQVEVGSLPPFTRAAEPRYGQARPDASGRLFLVHLGGPPWMVLTPETYTVKQGGKVALTAGVMIAFGDGKRHAAVVE